MLVDIWVDSGVEGPSTLCQVDDWVDRGVEGTSTPLPVDNRRQGGRRSISTSLQVDDWVDKFKFLPTSAFALPSILTRVLGM